MTEARLIQVVALIVFIAVVIALTALTDHILGAWKDAEAPPEAEHAVRWCDRNGHKYMEQDGWWRCAHCGDTVRRDPVEEPPLVGGIAKDNSGGWTAR